MASELPRAPAAEIGAPTSGLRLLVLAESLPWPPLKGGDLRTWQHVHALAQMAQVGVFGLCSNDARRAAPPPGLPLAFWKASTDPALTSPPPKGVRLAARAWLIEPTGHPSDLNYSPGAADELAHLLASFSPDVVIVCSLWLHSYLEMLRAAGCRIILDCHNVEALVARELAETRDGTDLEARVIREVLPARTEATERGALAAADQIWACSDRDASLLCELYAPRSPVVVVPSGIRMEEPPRREYRSAAPGGKPLTLFFPAMYAYPPNALAASFLIDRVLPRLAAADVPCCLQLVGPSPTEEMRAATARDPRIVVTGPVHDLQSFFAEATAMAVPLFQGGGTRLKVLEAFTAGLPVVSTTKGVEGLGARPGRHFLAAETAQDFVDGVLAVWHDGELARRLATDAHALVAERFSWDVIAPRVRDALQDCAKARVGA